MRDIWLIAWVFVGLGYTIRFPFIGLLLWEWLSLMAPHMQAYGFSRTFPLNLVVAVVTILSWLRSDEPKRFPSHPVVILSAVFLVWMTFNSFFAFDPAWSWPYWDRTWKIFLFGLLVSAMATNKARIDAIIWIAAISLLYFGVKGGLFTIASGGHYKVYGPDGTIIADNNQLALALVMVLPLVSYLRTTVSSKPLLWFLNGAIVCVIISILGSYSRGAYVAATAIGILAILKTRRKVLLLSMLLATAVTLFFFAPTEIIDRAATIQSANEDASFRGRVVAWQVALRYATDHFPFGAGFYGPQLPGIFLQYFPGESLHAAHSIYFQVLGEHGFIGLALYIAILLSAYLLCRKIASAKQNESTVWIQKLAAMIQISLFAFMIGGAALSMAYYDLFIMLIFMLPQLARMSEPVKKQPFRAQVQTAALGKHSY